MTVARNIFLISSVSGLRIISLDTEKTLQHERDFSSSEYLATRGSLLKKEQWEDVYLSEEFVEQMKKLNPEWDEPFSISSETLNLAKNDKRYDDSVLCRKSMRDKIKSFRNERVMLLSITDFNENKFVKNLPSSGAVLFVIDDPFHSTDLSSRCPDPSKLDDPRILAIAAEDSTCTHSKMNQIPIGVESMLMVGEHKNALHTFEHLKDQPIPAHQRRYNVQSDAHMHIFHRPASKLRADRQDMVAGVQRSAIDDWYEHHIDMDSHFKNHVSQSRLALCPEGNGADTHRFYHSYALRTRCIVRAGSLSQLHSQFPGTIIVDDWHQVTAENIDKWIQEGNATYDPDLLTSDYWINKFLKPYNIQTR
jgi:hypothetical protein